MLILLYPITDITLYFLITAHWDKRWSKFDEIGKRNIMKAYFQKYPFWRQFDPHFIPWSNHIYSTAIFLINCITLYQHYHLINIHFILFTFYSCNNTVVISNINFNMPVVIDIHCSDINRRGLHGQCWWFNFVFVLLKRKSAISWDYHNSSIRRQDSYLLDTKLIPSLFKKAAVIHIVV